MCVYMYELAGVHITHDTFYEFCQGSLFDVKPNKVYKQFKLFRIVDNLLFYRIFAFRHKMFNYFFFNFFFHGMQKKFMLPRCYRQYLKKIVHIIYRHSSSNMYFNIYSGDKKLLFFSVCFYVYLQPSL